MRTFIEIADDLNDLLTELNDKIVESIWAKTADVAPVRHGRWISDDIGFKCTSCGSHDESTSIYCPNCGAKMDEEN